VLNALSNTQKAFEGLKKPARFNDEFTGGTIGGPVWKDHVFFFAGLTTKSYLSNRSMVPGSRPPRRLVSPHLRLASQIARPSLRCRNMALMQSKRGTRNRRELHDSEPYHLHGRCNAKPGIEWHSTYLTDSSRSYNFPIKLDLQTAKNTSTALSL